MGIMKAIFGTWDDPLEYGYIPDGKGWTARPRSEYKRHKEMKRAAKAEKKYGYNPAVASQKRY